METFKQIQGFPDYQIGEFGTVKSFKNGKERILRPGLTGNGYLQVNLWLKSTKSYFYVHRLVAIHHIPNPENLPQVNHKDGNKLNCRADNLEWSTEKANIKHAVETGLMDFKGEKHPRAKLTPEQVEQIRGLKGIKKQSDIAIMFNIAQSQVCRIMTRKRW